MREWIYTNDEKELHVVVFDDNTTNRGVYIVTTYRPPTDDEMRMMMTYDDYYPDNYREVVARDHDELYTALLMMSDGDGDLADAVIADVLGR